MSRLDFIPVERAAWPVNPGDFIRPDGSIEVTPDNEGDPAHVEAIRQHIDRLREATPVAWDTPKHEGGEL